MAIINMLMGSSPLEQAIAEIAHKVGALLLVDNSIMSPVLSRPLALGAGGKSSINYILVKGTLKGTEKEGCSKGGITSGIPKKGTMRLQLRPPSDPYYMVIPANFCPQSDQGKASFQRMNKHLTGELYSCKMTRMT